MSTAPITAQMVTQTVANANFKENTRVISWNAPPRVQSLAIAIPPPCTNPHPLGQTFAGCPTRTQMLVDTACTHTVSSRMSDHSHGLHAAFCILADQILTLSIICKFSFYYYFTHYPPPNQAMSEEAPTTAAALHSVRIPAPRRARKRTRKPISRPYSRWGRQLWYLKEVAVGQDVPYSPRTSNPTQDWRLINDPVRNLFKMLRSVVVFDWVTPKKSQLSGQTVPMLKKDHGKSGGRAGLSSGCWTMNHSVRVRIQAPTWNHTTRVVRTVDQLEGETTLPPFSIFPSTKSYTPWISVWRIGSSGLAAVNAQTTTLSYHYQAQETDVNRGVYRNNERKGEVSIER
ncbi:hypothetical protein OG21DRAFT_1605374 [Imleria badia]|nr:hypothetical protein OG21DRAFT_1605374 [Imleria badia]